MKIKLRIRFAIMLAVIFSAELSFSQGREVALDSLMIGGIYEVLTTDGRQFLGELLSRDTSGLRFNTDEDILDVKPGQIKMVRIPYFNLDRSSEVSENELQKKKFRFMGFVNAGISMPTGAFGDIHKTGFGINASIYHLFDRLMGIGTEMQFNMFPGDVYTYRNSYSESRYQSESYSIYSFKANLLVGNLRPEDYLIAYGLFGVGLQYYSEGSVTSTYIHFDPYYPYTYSSTSPDISGLSFLFGAGAGISYKISKKIRINGELQFNKLPKLDYNFSHDYGSNEFDGYFSFKTGIMYTY